jgi:hypothetical protein
MSIATGIAALKAGVELTRVLRDGLKGGQIKGDEVAGRIGEIYDNIADSKDALSEAKDEIQILKQKVFELEAELCRRRAMKFAFGAYWTREDGPFCQLCWEAQNKPIRLLGIFGIKREDSCDLIYTCNFHQDVRVALPEGLKAFREKLIADGHL